jgi:hypothetical protein
MFVSRCQRGMVSPWHAKPGVHLIPVPPPSITRAARIGEFGTNERYLSTRVRCSSEHSYPRAGMCTSSQAQRSLNSAALAIECPRPLYS